MLSTGGLATARAIRTALPETEILGLEGRVGAQVDRTFTDMTAAVRALFAEGRPILGLCASGILIRMVAPLLGAKRQEPPVIAIAEDGTVVVPLIGGLTGANELATAVAETLGTRAAITGSGARKFGIILERPPVGWTCANPDDAKRVTADLLAGAHARVEGALPWLADTTLPQGEDGAVLLRASIHVETMPERGLLYRPRAVIAALTDASADPEAALARAGIAPAALAAIVLAEDGHMPDRRAGVTPVRIVAGRYASAADLALQALGGGGRLLSEDEGMALAAGPGPIDPDAVGRPRGRLAVVGLGPGAASWRTPEATAELETATDIVGYAPYVAQVPQHVRARARCHSSDNRAELDRARQALDMAAEGRRVAIVSSGDPGIFAMAAAVLEALETPAPTWSSVEIVILPGLSAMQAAAARTGAMLGHDFAVISLSDNLKPWAVIARRLRAALTADFALALYNPVSRARPHRLAEAIALIARQRDGGTPVVLGADVGRPDERTRIVTLANLAPAMVDSRTVILVGSSRTRQVRVGGRTLAYTPRSYPDG